MGDGAQTKCKFADKSVPKYNLETRVRRQKTWWDERKADG